MKTNTPIIIGTSSTMPNRQMLDALLTKYFDIFRYPNGTLELQSGKIQARLIRLSADMLTQRIMCGDVSLGIASLGEFISEFRARGKYIIGGDSIGDFDDRYRKIQPIIMTTGGDSFDEANKYSYRETGELKTVIGKDRELYRIPFTIDERSIGEDVQENFFPVGVVLLRNMRKNPELRALVSLFSNRAALLYEESPYYRDKYPRG